MKFLAMFFMLLLCGLGPSYEKFFIVSVNDNSVNKSDTLSEGRQSYCFINILICVKGGFHRNRNDEQEKIGNTCI